MVRSKGKGHAGTTVTMLRQRLILHQLITEKPSGVRVNIGVTSNDRHDKWTARSVLNDWGSVHAGFRHTCIQLSIERSAVRPLQNRSWPVTVYPKHAIYRYNNRIKDGPQHTNSSQIAWPYSKCPSRDYVKPTFLLPLDSSSASENLNNRL
ncbi:hypothetical protein GWI33_002625 [Rhynchophorus ferrugineus]|uniref:Uncharacterized protein n=1 Tax=Rhynchophorus ferrugineus TaxID=354439 RepID=A0A834MJJ0_RHYFE|nr:hypothetical protein GWI33_002625 [Rhynchophorus ferrugineus]